MDLAYADPPFATGGARAAGLDPDRERGADAAGVPRAGGGATRRSATWPATTTCRWTEHLEALAARVREIHRVLAPHGSLYLHVDWRTVAPRAAAARRGVRARAVPQRDRLGVRLRRPAAGPLAAQARHDPVVREGRPWLFDREAIDRIPYMAPGLVGPEKAARGKLPTDVWWMTIVPPASAERTGYPTQKPVRLLERIVAASSRPGDLVLDPYAGSGTTGVAAARLGRRWLLVDRNPVAVEIARGAAGGRGGRPVSGAVIRAITLDFGNTLVPVSAAGLRGGRGRRRPRRWRTASGRSTWTRCSRPGARSASASSARRCRSSARWTSRSGSCGSWPGCAGWRRRRPTRRWDDAAAARLSTPDEVDWAVEVYSRGFVAALPPAPAAGAAAGAARRRGTASRSCRTGRSPRPSTATSRRPAGRRTWPRSSSRSGSGRSSPTRRSSPRPGRRWATRSPRTILHVGDDWAADVVGAKRAGWRAAWLASRPADSPLPGSARDDEVEADLELATLDDLEAGWPPGLTEARRTTGRGPPQPTAARAGALGDARAPASVDSA